MKLAEENVKASLLKKRAEFIYRLWTAVNGQWSRKNYFNHCLTGKNSFQRLLIDVQAEESEFSNVGTMSEAWRRPFNYANTHVRTWEIGRFSVTGKRHL